MSTTKAAAKTVSKAATKPATKAEVKATFKPPKTLAACADLLFTTRAKRLLITKEVDALQAQETALREHLINTLPKSEASGIAGKLARVSIESKTVVSVKDFDAVVAYVVKTYKRNPGVAALLRRQVSEATVKEMWAAGADVPGTEPLDIPVVSVNKL